MIEIDPNFTIYVDDKFYQHTQPDAILNKNSYQYIGKKYNLQNSNLVLFTVTVLIGKYILNSKKQLEDRTSLLKWGSIEKTDEMLILKAIAIEETNDMDVLEKPEVMAKIWEEYAMAGMEELCKWIHDNSIDEQSKIEDLMLDYFENHYKKEEE